MKFFRQIFELNSNDRSRQLIVIADDAESALDKITNHLQKCYGDDGYTLRFNLQGPHTHESLATVTGYGLSLQDVLLPEDRQRYLEHVTEEKILREEERERERRKRAKEKRERTARNRRVLMGHA